MFLDRSRSFSEYYRLIHRLWLLETKQTSVPWPESLTIQYEVLSRLHGVTLQPALLAVVSDSKRVIFRNPEDAF